MNFKLILFSVLIVQIVNAQVSDFKTVDFNRADNIAKLNDGTNLNNLPLLAHQLTFKLDSDVEKFRAIYTWVCNNIKGDLNQSNIVSRKRNKYKNDSISYLKWNNDYKKTVFKKLFKHKKAMCSGYAYLIKELCFLADIECEIIDGYGRTVTSNIHALEMANHSWNAVKLNNKWYLSDATWSSGYSLDNGMFIKDYNDGYFLTDPLLFAQNHLPIDEKWTLDTTSSKQFITAPLVYGETFKYQIIPVSPTHMKFDATINKPVDFSFRTLNKISTNRVSLIYYSGITEHSFPIYDLKNEDGRVIFKCTFKNKGSYDVHLKIDNDIVATYIIQVNKI